MIVRVRKITDRFAITLDDGQAVFDRIHPALRAGSAVCLDFEGVHVFASPFFNAAIGQLVQHFDADDLNHRLEIRNLPSDGEAVLRRVIENAKRYYSDEMLQKRLSHIVADQVGATGCP